MLIRTQLLLQPLPWVRAQEPRVVLGPGCSPESRGWDGVGEVTVDP